MLQRLLIAALLAGIAAGLALTGIQALRAVPLIHQAEVYESAAQQAEMAHGQAGHEDEGWQPVDGLERFAYTLLANLLAGIGFALLLVAGYGFFRPRDWRGGLLWGLAGFGIFALAPALGLPPELPGTASAGLHTRQLWWLLAAGSTAAGLGLIAFAPRWGWKALGLALLVLPHAVGAPHPAHEAMAAPAELAHQFVVASLLSNLAFWLVLGPLTAWLFGRLVPRDGGGQRHAG